MREIKFRGKMVGKNGINDWVFGHIQPVFTGMCIMQVCKYKNSSGIELFQIDENTVGQYTGIKDKNGVEIYEGDVIEIHHGNGNKTTGVVFYWDRFCAVFLMMESGEPRCLFQEWGAFRKCVYAYIQVIGNVFDNPELKERFWAVWNQENLNQ